MAILERFVTAIVAATEATQAAVEALRSSPHFEQFAAQTSPQSLTRGDYAYCRRIMPLADGTIVVKQRDGQSRALTVVSGQAEPIEATELTSSTGICKVYW
jgi:hypothetical protein